MIKYSSRSRFVVLCSYDCFFLLNSRILLLVVSLLVVSYSYSYLFVLNNYWITRFKLNARRISRELILFVISLSIYIYISVSIRSKFRVSNNNSKSWFYNIWEMEERRGLKETSLTDFWSSDRVSRWVSVDGGSWTRHYHVIVT